jgi:hypothetical protein
MSDTSDPLILELRHELATPKRRVERIEATFPYNLQE